MFLGLFALMPPVLDGPLLMRHPTMSQTQIVFEFAGDLWTVKREGGDASRITNSPGRERGPYFSPDGTMIAFTGEYYGNEDVYVMPAGGGEPKRLTFNPAVDIPAGWTPDGKNITFVSTSESNTDLPGLYTVPVTGGLPKRLPVPSGTQISMSPDGTRMAYNPGIQWQNAWKRYRGGQTSPLWIANLSDSTFKEIPRNNSNDSEPCWVGDKVYFLSDRNGPKTLFSYDLSSGKVSELVKNDGFDMKTAVPGPGAIVIEHLGEIETYDLATGKLNKVDIRIAGDFPEARTQFKDASQTIYRADISPNGVRAVFEARGDIFTVPESKGDVKNLTQTSNVHERSPAWSPDGQSICYFSDASGEYQLVIRDATGKGESKSYELGLAKAFYYNPVWSPDSAKVSYTDNQHNLWYLDVKTGKNTKVDTNPYENPTFIVTGTWSPDSKWLAYHRDLDSHLTAVFLYSLESGKSTQMTDGMSDAKAPAFDKNGKYLYFTASTNSGPQEAWLDLSSYHYINTVASVYVAVLRNDLPSPIAPESDDEKPKPAVPAKPEEKKEEFRIDLDGIGQRILALPMPAKNYVGLEAGPAGSVFAVDTAPLATITSRQVSTLVKFNLADRKPTPIASGFRLLSFTPNGEKMLMLQGTTWSINPTGAPVAPGQGQINTADMNVMVNPLEEWKHMYHEAWRVERDFLYAPNYHGIDLDQMEKRYQPFVANLRSRADLNYLFEDMLGEISVGHMFIGGGDIPSVTGTPGGLLGADYSIENGRYRFARVYNGENWNPQLQAPLTQPGVNVKAGEYLLAVDGKDLTASMNVHQALEGKAGKQVLIKVGPNVDGTGSREVVVVPTESETGLRTLAWEEDNRRLVEKLSGGRLGYMHIPDTNIGGWTNFTRYFYAQVGKEGLIVDERFNHGGQVDDFMVENLTRPLMSMWTPRYGKDMTSPLSAVFGPKVMIINQYAGSGGDYFPWHFKKVKAGPVIGKRTWGGLVGILDFPPLIDGGGVTAPNLAFYNPNGTWEVENHGVDPDIEVEMDPALWRKGHDPQLERAIEEGMKLLAKNPAPKIAKPAYPDKSKLGNSGR